MSPREDLAGDESVELIDTAAALIDSFGNVLNCNSSFEMLVLGKVGRSSRFFALRSFGYNVGEAFKKAVTGRFAEAKVFIEHKGYLDDWRVVFVPQEYNNVLLIFVGRMNDAAYHDPLTGLPSRAVALDRLEHELDRWNRSKKSPFGIALADIDHFKSVNDSYGHDIGDQVLKCVADTFTKSLRSGDWVARWGGEEFLFLFHDVHQHAFEACDRCRVEIENTPFVNEDGLRIDLTVSFGVVNVLDEDSKSTGRVSIERMIENADVLLYDAKRAGRNRTVRRELEEQINWTAAELVQHLERRGFLPQRIPLVDKEGKVHGSLWKPQIDGMSASAAHHLFLSAARTNMLGKAESAWIDAVLQASSDQPKDQFNLVTVSHNLLRRFGDFPGVAEVVQRHEKSGRRIVLTVKQGQPHLAQDEDLRLLAKKHGLEFCPWVGSDPVSAASIAGTSEPQFVLIDTKRPPETDVLESLMKMFSANNVTLIMSQELYNRTSQQDCDVLFITQPAD